MRRQGATHPTEAREASDNKSLFFFFFGKRRTFLSFRAAGRPWTMIVIVAQHRWKMPRGAVPE
jgi:hypothetical protein